MDNEIQKRNVRLVKVDRKNFDSLVDLTPDEVGRHYVADNIYSLAEAYANLADGNKVQPFGIYDGDTPVGFVMIGYDIIDENDDLDKQYFIKDCYLVWRFMIDEKYQHKGYGKEGLKLALDYIRTFPFGKAEYCWLSYEPENDRARKLYQSFGFVEEKEMPEGWDEIPAVLKL